LVRLGGKLCIRLGGDQLLVFLLHHHFGLPDLRFQLLQHLTLSEQHCFGSFGRSVCLVCVFTFDFISGLLNGVFHIIVCLFSLVGRLDGDSGGSLFGISMVSRLLCRRVAILP